MERNGLKRLSERRFKAVKGDVTFALMAKNEIAIIGEFLDHHRSIGATQFLTIDNGSDDGTLEFLLDQPDCVVYRTEDAFADANFGMDWINQLMREHGEGGWFAYLDCDEHLQFPGMDRRSVQDFAAALRAEGHDGVHAVMVDMYPAADFTEIDLAGRDRPLAEIMNYFDRDYVVRRRPHRPWRAGRRAPLQILGGPRCRLLSDLRREAGRGWRHAMFVGQIDRFVHKLPASALPLAFRLWPRLVPALQKTPLTFVGPQTRYLNSHDATNVAIAPTLLCLLHFKFCSELAVKDRATGIAEHHYRRGMEREQLRLALLDWKADTLLYEGSVEYRSHRDLEEAGLLGDQFADVLTQYNA
ncbi:MAG: glycosyltransferase family 2 protein [Pseudomonadota bacterium]